MHRCWLEEYDDLTAPDFQSIEGFVRFHSHTLNASMCEYCRMLKLVRRSTCFACNASPDSALLLKKSLLKVRAAVQTGAYTAYLYTLKLIGEIARKAFGSEPE